MLHFESVRRQRLYLIDPCETQNSPDIKQNTLYPSYIKVVSIKYTDEKWEKMVDLSLTYFNDVIEVNRSMHMHAFITKIVVVVQNENLK